MRRRGEVWLADLNPRRGTEPGKTRPVLVVQAQALLDAEHPSTLAVSLTTRLDDDAEHCGFACRPVANCGKNQTSSSTSFARSIITDG
jgi:mRNA-degrading endonuclease toxin of MazEF toxin-antitoxin module